MDMAEDERLGPSVESCKAYECQLDDRLHESSCPLDGFGSVEQTDRPAVRFL